MNDARDILMAMTPRHRDHCRSCKAPIFYVTMAKTGKSMPLDAKPNDEGNVIWPWGHREDGTPLAWVERKDELPGFRDKLLLYSPHWSTCPAAEKFRKQRPKRVKS